MFLSKFLIVGAAVAVAAVGDVGDKDVFGDATTTTTTTRTVVRKALEEKEIHPDLVFGDINILVVSDVHSHVGGHPHEPDKNADYGDLYSFHERLAAHLEDNRTTDKGDLWLFNNGDILHGTGLAMNGNATNLLPIVSAMPWDSMTMGRQEATYSDVLKDMSHSVVPRFPGKYITSNVVWNNEAKNPYGARYQLLQGKTSTLLVFGFLYDTVSSSETIQVLSIEETVQEDWFKQILRQENHYDAIVVMAQMDIDSPSIMTILKEIRANVPTLMPIQFIAGHSHKRALSDRRHKDQMVHTIEPGGLFDTIGWVAMPKFSTVQEHHNQQQTQNNSSAIDQDTMVFHQEFLNTSKAVLHSRLGLAEEDELLTENGRGISQLIRDTQDRLGLNQVVACPGHDYQRNISIFDDRSLWKLWRDHVVRNQIFEKGQDRIMLVSKGILRYDLKGSGRHDAMTLDDVVAIAPYMEKVVYVGEVPDWMIRRMNQTLNSNAQLHHNPIPDFVLAGDLEEVKTAESYKLYTHEMDVPRIKAWLEKRNYQDFVLEYTKHYDTKYWLDYLMTAYPCEVKGNETFELPYFFDPNELEEEATDGKLTDEDMEGTNTNDDDDIQEGTIHIESSEDETWTLPPDGGYLGYIPGKGDAHVVDKSKYENYKSKDEIEEEERQKAAEEAAKLKGKNMDLKSQREERKKHQKKIIKGFALTFAGALLLVPVVCLVMQIMGRNDYYDDYNDGVMAQGMYDPQEMKLLRQRRKKGTQPTKAEESLYNAPFKEIEII